MIVFLFFPPQYNRLNVFLARFNMAQIFMRKINLGKNLSVLSSSLSNSGRSLSNKSDKDASTHSKPYDRMPRVLAVPLIGSTWAYFPYIGRYSVEKMHKADVHKHMTYGKMVREKFGTLEIVNCYSPEAMYTMMKEDDEYPSRGTFATLKAHRDLRRTFFSPAGLLVTDGQEWKRMRDSIQAYTSVRNFPSFYIESMNEVAKDFVRLIKNSRDNKQEIENAVAYLNKWSLEAISVVALDRRLGCFDPNLESTSTGMKLLEALEIQLECMNKLEATAGNIPFWKYFHSPTWNKFVKAADTFTSLTLNAAAESSMRALTEYIVERESLQSHGNLSLCKHLAKREQGGIAVAILMTDLMIAGIDTTSNTAGFLLYELAKNPEKQDLVVKELNTLLPAKGDRLTFEKYKELKYLRNCMKESMRLHPVVRGNIRIFKKDVEICGYNIPAGTPVICVLQVVYRDSTYFRKPNVFYPERWEEEQKYPFFQPFGYGARNCIGNSLAELEILTMSAEVLRNFRLEYHYEDIDMTTRLINTPDRPIKLRLLER